MTGPERDLDTIGASDAEDRRKGDKLVRRMLSMRPKPQEEFKVGKRRRRGERQKPPEPPETMKGATDA